MVLALSDGDADVRRDAAVRVAESSSRSAPWALEGMITIALLESDSQTRCVAIRALAQGGDPRGVDAILKVLTYAEYPPAEVRPPSDVVRWDATDALAGLAAAGRVPEASRAAAAAALIACLGDARDRNVRIAAARGLGCFPQEDVVQALIAALRSDDFGLVHAAELSLVRLTGVTHDCSALAWTEWFEANRAQLFARAGEVPESRRPKYNGPIDRSMGETRDLVRWLFPGQKQK